MIENLAIAADDPLCTHKIMDKIFDEIARHIPDRARKTTSHNGQEDDSHGGMIDKAYNSFLDDGFYLYEIATAIADGDLDERRLGWIKDGFAILCSESLLQEWALLLALDY